MTTETAKPTVGFVGLGSQGGPMARRIAAFGHGAKLLAKDVGLLVAVISDDPGGVMLRATAEPFLNRIAQMQGRQP